jgi:hypothetical protein
MAGTITRGAGTGGVSIEDSEEGVVEGDVEVEDDVEGEVEFAAEMTIDSWMKNSERLESE